MCRERKRTRDRLLEYDNTIMPLYPHTAGLASVYPWENVNLNILIHELYQIAAISGFSGDELDFKENFGTYIENKPIIYAIYTDFPAEGEQQKLYFDLNEKILYYWDNDYIPVNAMLIAHTILEGGEA